MSGGASGRQVGLYGWRVMGWSGGGGDNRQMQVTCLGFATACVPNDKHRVSNLKQLLQLYNLQHEAVLRLQLELHNALLDDLGDKAEDGAGRRPLVWMSLQVLTLMSLRAPIPDPSVTLRVLKPRIGWGAGSSSRPQDPGSQDQASQGGWRLGGKARITFSKFRSRFRGTSRAGKRSPISPMNTGKSSVTILGILKSLSALMSTWSSARVGSPLFKEPATTSTDLMARRPQS